MQSSGGCHRCLCPPANYLDTSKVFEAKTTAHIKKRVVVAAGGAPGAQRPVALFSMDGKTSSEGPAAGSYEKARKQLIHTKKYPGVQRLQCWPFADQKFYGYDREDFGFVRPPRVEQFVLSPANVWMVDSGSCLSLLSKLMDKLSLSISSVPMSPSDTKSSWNSQVLVLHSKS